MALGTMNKITVTFATCTPAPTHGYNVNWRVAGSGDPYTNAGNFFVNPAVFYDAVNPTGTCYEGYIVTDCGGGIFGNPQAWETCESESGSGESGDPGFITLTFSVTGGGAGANIKALFSAPIDVDLSIDSVFVDGFTSGDCDDPGDVDSHMHSTVETIAAGNTAYIGADVKTGAWLMVNSFLFYGITLSWPPSNSSVIAHNGDVVTMGAYSVTIIIEGC